MYNTIGGRGLRQEPPFGPPKADACAGSLPGGLSGASGFPVNSRRATEARKASVCTSELPWTPPGGTKLIGGKFGGMLGLQAYISTAKPLFRPICWGS